MFFDNWDEDVLGGLLKTQRAVVEHREKEKASKRLFGIAIVVDDFADDPRVMSSRAGGSALNTLLTRGRHMSVSTYILSQRLRPMGSLLRTNAQSLVISRLRNRLELDAIVEELSAVYEHKK